MFIVCVCTPGLKYTWLCTVLQKDKGHNWLSAKLTSLIDGKYSTNWEKLYRCVYSTGMCNKWFRQIFSSRVVQQLFAEHSIKYLWLVTWDHNWWCWYYQVHAMQKFASREYSLFDSSYCFAEHSQTVNLSVNNSWLMSTTVL